MKTEHDTLAFPRITRREGLLTLLASAMALAGCGGGGGVASVGGGGTGSFSAGPISGFGSIIVNGIRFDDSTARVLDDDGAAHNRGELKLGMMVRVKGKAKARKADNTDDADEITFGSELLGPIDSIDTVAKTLLVLGQTVQITASTIFEDGLTLSVLKKDDIVEVHGFVDPVTNVINATRIESKVLANVKTFKLQGRISSLTPTTFQIGGLTISFTLSVDKPASLVLAEGLLVRVRLDPNPPTSTPTRTATKIRAVGEEIEDHDEAEVEGTITAFTSSTKFSVNGLPVDASGSGIIVPVGLAVGVQVEVEGRLVNGVLVAKTVKLEDENEEREFELHGTVSLSAPTSFTLTSSGGVAVKVTFPTDVRFDNGTIANLLSGAKVEVKGVASSDGTSRIVATRIRFE